MHIQHVAPAMMLQVMAASATSIARWDSTAAAALEADRARMDVNARGAIANTKFSDVSPTAPRRSALMRERLTGQQSHAYSMSSRRSGRPEWENNDVNPGGVHHGSPEPAIMMYDDNSCKGSLVYNFTANFSAAPTGENSSLCLAGTRFENQSLTENTDHDAALPSSANYNCDGYRGQLSVYNDSETCGDTPECVFELSDSMAEAFRRGGCAIVVWRDLDTRAQLRACGWVQSIKMQNVSRYSFRGANFSNDCSQGVNFQPGDQDGVVPKSDEPFETGSGKEEKTMIFLILFPIMVLSFLLGTVFIIYWFRKRQKELQAEAAAERTASASLMSPPAGVS